MTVDAATIARVIEARRIVREHEALMIDRKGYRDHPMGQEVARWLQHLRWEGASDNTITSYESVAAYLVVDFEHYTSLAQFCTPVGGQYLKEFLQARWGRSSPATRQHHQSVIRSLVAWAVGEGIMPYQPVQSWPRVRKPRSDRVAFHAEDLWGLIAAQPEHRDQVCLMLAWPLGLRKNEIRNIQLRDIDLTRDLITVRGKGSKTVVMPIAFKRVRDELYLHLQARGGRPDDYLLYGRRGPREQLDRSSVHRWFKRCLARAGMSDGVRLHELRHSSGDHMWRATGNIVLAQLLLRHESVGTTQEYLHPTIDDLAAGMRTVEKTWESK